MKRLLLSLVLPCALAACGSETESSPAAEPPPAEPTGPALEVEWGSCPFGTGGCYTFEVPLDWEQPEGQKVDFQVRRIPATGESRGQLWLLQGGPGSSGWLFTQQVSLFRSLAPDFDLYIPDYRGVGYSSWLGCKREAGGDFSIYCMETLRALWGDEALAHFSTSDTARDIGWVIGQIRKPGEKVYLYGVSYGTFLLNRYLNLFPDQADAAVLDSVCPAGGCDVRMDRNFNKVARHVFDSCAQDAFCSSKLGADPWQSLLDLFDAMAMGHCSEFLGYPANEYVLGQMVLESVTSPQMVPLAMATVYRAERCNAADVAALESLYEALYSPSGYGFDTELADSESLYLSLHVVFSEFWPEDLTREKALAELAELPMESGALRTWAELKEYWSWPLTPKPTELMRWAPTSTPLLLLNGDIDGQTHLDGLVGVEQSFRNDWQHYVQMPWGGHSILLRSLSRDGRTTCGAEIITDFFADPKGSLDTSCIDAVRRLSFQGSSTMARHLLGTTDLWENQTTGRAMVAPLTEVESQAIEELRRRLQQPVRF